MQWRSILSSQEPAHRAVKVAINKPYAMLLRPDVMASDIKCSPRLMLLTFKYGQNLRAYELSIYSHISQFYSEQMPTTQEYNTA